MVHRMLYFIAAYWGLAVPTNWIKVFCAACTLVFYGSHGAIAQDAAEKCKGLLPTGAQDISESFKGKVEGRLGGLLGKLTGGVAGLEGEYEKITKDTLKDFPESHKLYVWQELIYLACLDNKSGIDLNELLKAYLVGPSTLDPTPKTKLSDIEIEFVGLDSQSTTEALAIHGAPGIRSAMLPDLVFSFTNVSSKDVHVQLDECSFADFNYPRQISMRLQSGAAVTLHSITGTALMKAVGPYNVIVPPGQKRMKSYGIFSVDAPSFEARQRGTSFCDFRVGDDAIFKSKPVTINNRPQFFAH